MKKLLILMLVLGMASAASAVPIITGATTIAPGGTVTLTLSGTSAEASTTADGSGGFGISGVFIDVVNNSYYAPVGLFAGSTISNASGAHANMGGLGSVTAYYGGISFLAAPVVPWAEATDVDTGTWFTFDVYLSSGYAGATDGSVYMPIDIGWGTTDVGGVDLQIIPEPVTIALLGLGGLLLRRRK